MVDEVLLPEVLVLFLGMVAVCGEGGGGFVAEVEEGSAGGAGRVGVPGGTVVHHLFLFDE